ncbi:hypothetical protein [Bradyrhizobium japonicum]|uniref:hypothetical protein n=1 Tax=Bradyrhizobium japonicum TaxID=375 RepID=UPI000456DD46|nr:hypothetical protein [Bradyrhizobium japonicum]AHY52470.1 hypothetical protein BJS_05968 [Bradyrhizobium japonicum SEMIA 5079]MCD9110277.1 hypothetical protein [Bradyrhizobium japonicum]MCD9257456.1 hypothetical protein [Bradyrhizobium japonicum SEMIA 5079]MCD9823517.1 hypothetical protein [Bradyrhizobium japonicum]MCD9895120.1 hypothetical protein [Bradyrhizobium japonicum]
MEDHVAKRTPAGHFAPGSSGCLIGRRSVREKAARDEAERRQVEANLLRDLGREASVTEALAIEAVSAQVVRARRMRAAGRHDAAEMAERLVLRGLGRLGVRQGAAKPTSGLSAAERIAAIGAARKAAEEAL